MTNLIGSQCYHTLSKERKTVAKSLKALTASCVNFPREGQGYQAGSDATCLFFRTYDLTNLVPHYNTFNRRRNQRGE
jgi:hypothetical protein